MFDERIQWSNIHSFLIQSTIVHYNECVRLIFLPFNHLYFFPNFLYFLFLYKVVNKFKTLLSGYSQMPPVLFLICGNFLSQPYGNKHRQVFKEAFKELGMNLIVFYFKIVFNFYARHFYINCMLWSENFVNF